MRLSKCEQKFPPSFSSNRKSFCQKRPFAILMTAASVCITATLTFVQNTLSFLWRKHLTRSISDKYFRNDNFYTLLQLKLEDCDNVDQRITADIQAYCDSLSAFLVQLVSSSFNVFYLTYLVNSNLGGLTTFAIWSVPLFSVVVYKFLLTPISRAVFELDRAEGNFRYSHARMKQNSESIAFFSADENEKEKARVLLQEVVRMQKNVAYKSFWFSSKNEFFDIQWIVFSYFNKSHIVHFRIPSHHDYYDSYRPCCLERDRILQRSPDGRNGGQTIASDRTRGQFSHLFEHILWLTNSSSFLSLR